MLWFLLACSDSAPPPPLPPVEAPSPADEATDPHAGVPLSGADRSAAGTWLLGGPDAPGDWVELGVNPSVGVLIAATRQAAVVWVDLASGQVRMRRPEAEPCSGALCPAIRLGVGEASWGMARALTARDAGWERSGFDGSRGGGPLADAAHRVWDGETVHLSVEAKWGPGRRPVVVDVDAGTLFVVQPPADIRGDRWALTGGGAVWSTWTGDLVQVDGADVTPFALVGGGRLRDLAASADGRTLVALSGTGAWHAFRERRPLSQGAFEFPPAGLQPAGEGWMVGWSRRAVICYDIQTGKALGSWPIEASGPVRLSVHGEQAWAAIPGQGVAQLDLTGLCADSD